ncbi:type I-E CRISPR-associated protein Cas6/Cse3/CasE [Actinomyces viscosus]|uniref:CRISPR associated protein n=1 Tax=Actinomyces viscosus TaxID=1656 RepID=A0A3S5EWJ6_ACTVI|nr:type I-E CRISPR-associated protein Cas6/Cse3/CasE [Actinomyces viscosus]TFH51427.1 type I-E CRISPR-associated protein Cas6/Cse3/CasE [Actinomyces viscosus]VEI17678.1 CRISPR associated protein [Actinomyces viscosus]
MPDQIAVLPLAEALSHLSTPDAVHHLAMSYLPDLGGASRSIRADLGVLYRLALPTDYGGQSGSLVIRFRTDIDLPGTQAIGAPSGFVIGQRFTVRVVAEKRHADESGRNRVRAVLDEEAHGWAVDLLERHGLTVSEPTVSPRWFVGRRGGRSFTLRDLTGTISHISEAGESAYRQGIGRGKAYGYGMPLVL